MEAPRCPTPLRQVRRRDRAVTDEAWIEDLLESAAVGVLAAAASGQPEVNANLFVYDRPSRCIFLHTARVGLTRAIVEAHPRVAFTVFRLGRLLPAATALEFSAEFDSVVAVGTCSVVEDREEAKNALEALLAKYAPHLLMGEDYREPVPAELKRTTVLRVRIDAWSGKRKVAAPDFPGAYHYEGAAGPTARDGA
ncbi:MAG TPA: pyridoxamine 5'-phosphate oxidase family protein [Longimicrobiales bacterium]|nr:pyridoxamine 5'-phosphate oxidase family protein [Longimicrobiales bacterium]